MAPDRIRRLRRIGAKINERIVHAAILTLLLVPLLAFADDPVPPGKVMSTAERTRWFEETRERQKGINGLSASVTQRKRHPLLKEEAVSKGKLSFRKPGALRWEVEKPESIVVVVNSGMITTYYPLRRKAERRDARDNIASRAAMDFLASGIFLSLPDLERRFLVDLFRGDGQVILRLIPRSKMLSRSIASIRIVQDAPGGLPQRIVVQGTKGDLTETTFSGVAINPAFPPDTFTLRLGPEVRVTETGHSGRDRIDGP
ncbi:MAG: outer membrane lipoprotein carrier protein LolA [Deltaproteobacteria bacterium]|nr:outer membrane lipoprotein carrier protein LolA [Deltaproteobacteria bacterium]